MALRSAFGRQPATNLGFSFCFCSVLSGLDDCYYCSNIIVSLFFKLCAKFSLRVLESSKSWSLLSRNRFCLLDEKIRDKSPDHLFDLNFFDSMLHTISLLTSVQSVLI